MRDQEMKPMPTTTPNKQPETHLQSEMPVPDSKPIEQVEKTLPVRLTVQRSSFNQRVSDDTMQWIAQERAAKRTLTVK